MRLTVLAVVVVTAATGTTLLAQQPAGQSENSRKPDRIFGVLPNYGMVEHENQESVTPRVTSKDAFRMAALNSFADNAIGNFLTTAVVSSTARQDPRYFALGEGSLLHRIAYAASRSIVTRSRDGKRQFNVSEIGGNGVAALLSNLYYPAEDRSGSGTLTRWGAQVMWDTLSNELKEFWPDLRRKFHKPPL